MSSALIQSLPCGMELQATLGGGFRSKTEGLKNIVFDTKPIPHPTSSGAPFTQGSLGRSANNLLYNSKFENIDRIL